MDLICYLIHFRLNLYSMHRIGLMVMTLIITTSSGLSQSGKDFGRLIESAQDSAQIEELMAKAENVDLTFASKIKLYDLIAQRSKRVGYTRGSASALYKSGLSFYLRNSFDSAELLLKQSADLYFEIGDIEAASFPDFYRSQAFQVRGLHNRGVEVLLRGLEGLKKTNDRFYNSYLRALGEIHRAQNNIQPALNYLNLAVDHAEKLDESTWLAWALNRRGVVYYQDSKHERAKLDLERSMTLSRENNLEYVIDMNLNDLGELYFALKEYERCIQLYELALERDLSESNRMNTYTNIGRLYWQLRDYRNAIDYASKALKMAQETNNLTYIVDAERILAESYMGLGRFKAAAKNYDLYISHYDSLKNVETRRLLAEADIKYQTELKEQEIVNLTEREALERSRKRTYQAGLIGVGALLLIVLFLIWQLFKNKNKIEAQNLELETLNTTKDKFFSIIAHDLRSPMIALQGVGQKLDFFIRKGKQEKLLEMGNKIDESIDRLNHLLNNLLNWASTESGGMPINPQQLQGDELIENTVNLYQSIAESKGVKIEMELSGAEVYGDRNMISTIIRNLLSNAVKFSPESGTVRVNSFELDGYTAINVMDSGKGMGPDQLKKLFDYSASELGSDGEQGFGLGLKLCKEFVKANHGFIEVESKLEEGSVFTIKIPNSFQTLNLAKVA